MQNLGKRGLKAAKYTAILKPVTQVSAMLVSILLIRGLSEQEFGVYNLLYSVISIIGLVASFGLANTLQRYLPEYYSKGEYVIANNLYRVSSVIRLLSNVAVLALIIYAWDVLAPHLKIEEYREYFLLFVMIILLEMQGRLLLVSLRAYFLHQYTQGFEALFIVLKGVGYFYFLVVDRVDLWNIILVDIACYVIFFAALQVVFWNKIPRKGGEHDRMSSTEKKRVIRYAAFYNFNDAGARVLDSQFDYFIIAMYLDPIAVAAYAFCYRVSHLVSRMMPVDYLLGVIRPALFAAGTNDKHEDININRFYQTTVKINYLFNIPALCLLAALGESLINVVFAGKYVEYAGVLTAVYGFIVFNSFQVTVGLIAQLREKAATILISKLFAVYNIIADIILIGYMGIWGAVVATGTAIFLKNIFIWYFVREEASFKGMSGYFVKMSFYWALVALVVYISGEYLVSDILTILVGLCIFGLAFLLQFRMKLFSHDEKMFLENVAGKSRKLNKLLEVL